MAECCNAISFTGKHEHTNCPNCGQQGKKVPVITLKSLLLPEALARLQPKTNYSMCINSACNIVYFNEEGEFFETAELKVPVFQKSDDENCPVCYCFGWTRKKIRTELEETGNSTALPTITEHIKAGRCGCEVNNPQGSCCLTNVKQVMQDYQKQLRQIMGAQP